MMLGLTKISQLSASDAADIFGTRSFVFPKHTAIIHGKLRRDYAGLYARCCQFANVLDRAGLGPGDTVSVMLLNTPAMIEAHYGVPMAGRFCIR